MKNPQVIPEEPIFVIGWHSAANVLWAVRLCQAAFCRCAFGLPVQNPLMDSMSITGAVTGAHHLLSVFKGITETVKASGKAEALSELIEADDLLLDLMQKQAELVAGNVELRERVRGLEAEQDRSRKMRHERLLYYVEGDPVPFCPLCWEVDRKLNHLWGQIPAVPTQPAFPKGPEPSEFWRCNVCGFGYDAMKGQNFRAELTVFRKRGDK